MQRNDVMVATTRQGVAVYRPTRLDAVCTYTLGSFLVAGAAFAATNLSATAASADDFGSASLGDIVSVDEFDTTSAHVVEVPAPAPALPDPVVPDDQGTLLAGSVPPGDVPPQTEHEAVDVTADEGQKSALTAAEDATISESIAEIAVAVSPVSVEANLPTPPALSAEILAEVDAEFRNPILSGIIGLVFHEAMTRVVRAFEARAAKLYG